MLVLWTQNLALLEDQGLLIQTSVLHLSYTKAASQIETLTNSIVGLQ